KLSSAAAHVGRVARNATNEPSVKYWRDQVEMLKRSLASQRKTQRAIAIRQLQQQDGGPKETRSEEIQQQLAVLEDLDQRLDAEIQRLNEGTHSLAVNTLDLQSIQDELAQVQEAGTKIGSEVEALGVELEAPPRVRKLEDAVVPISREDHKRYVMIGLITL